MSLRLLKGQCIYIILGGVDYTRSLEPIRFPNGTVKGDHRCFNITIVDDILAERNERFSIKAQVYVEDIPHPTSDCSTKSGSNEENCGPGNSHINRPSDRVNVERALNSSTGSISVTITDNDADGKCV